ncbi:MAG: hypothetical protein Q9O74_02830 [Planctomycetota bacterium]|nr:hypothetical protein [Planctomycetota bacterium]
MVLQDALADRWLSAAEVVASIGDAAAAHDAVRVVAEAAARAAPLERARLARCAELLVAEHAAARAAWDAHFAAGPGVVAADAVAEIVHQQVALPTNPSRATTTLGQTVVATAPVRIDLAGGWSDTPPICHELGGAVVNAAVSLDGQHPLRVMATLRKEPTVRITSIDLDQSVEYTRTEDLLSFREVRDWSSLPKAALVLSGFVPSDPSVDLGEWLGGVGGGVGGGVQLTLSAAVPKGSGLGTSSILGATALAALSTLAGSVESRDGLIACTSALEQLMRTGGGWQDQLGGIVPGCKIVRTVPGVEQRPVVEPIEIPRAAREELGTRMILYYTGLQRLAADIVQKVVGRYLAREPECLAIIRDLKSDAERMRDELACGDIDAFARTLGAYWLLKQRLDPGSTTPAIESLFAEVRDELSGYELPGAGGGGFLLLIATDAAAAERVRAKLGALRPNPTARLYDAAIDDRGLVVTVEP